MPEHQSDVAEPGATSVCVNDRTDQPPSTDDDVTALRLTYERRLTERDRIRAARAFFARQLGPVPVFAGLSVGLVGAFSEKIRDEAWLWIALGVFALMSAVSILYSRMPAYRELRAYRVRAHHMTEGQEEMAVSAWYPAESELERSVYGSGGDRARPWLWPRRILGADLQEQLDKERFGVFLVQGLFLLVIACLVLAR
jgi:hypothetical protein